jgi:hypothetical protein
MFGAKMTAKRVTCRHLSGDFTRVNHRLRSAPAVEVGEVGEPRLRLGSSGLLDTEHVLRNRSRGQRRVPLEQSRFSLGRKSSPPFRRGRQ